MVMKKAMSLIELVLTIVILGIVATGIPAILLQSYASTDESIRQEAILAAQNMIGKVVRAPWDENSYDLVPTNPLRVLRTDGIASADSAFDPRGASSPENTLRLGHVPSVNGERRKFLDPLLIPTLADRQPSATLGKEAGEHLDYFNDVDDYNDLPDTWSSHREIDDVGEKLLTLNILSEIKYVSDRANYSDRNITNFNFTTNPTGITNIKLISVSATVPGETNPSVILRAYVSNIGSSAIKRKAW